MPKAPQSALVTMNREDVLNGNVRSTRPMLPSSDSLPESALPSSKLPKRRSQNFGREGAEFGSRSEFLCYPRASVYSEDYVEYGRLILDLKSAWYCWGVIFFSYRQLRCSNVPY